MNNTGGTEYYRDFYGCHAKLVTYKNGSARLTVRTPQGHLVHAKNYTTRMGARIALGRLADGGWERRA